VNKSTGGDSSAMIKHEASFFKKHASVFDTGMVGSHNLRNRLMKVLETHMARSMDHIVDSVGIELDDARYQLKVHYNDRRISPESYVAECMDALKQRFKEFTKQFDKPTVRESITKMLESKMSNIISDLYWNDGNVSGLPKDCNSSPEWEAKLTQASNQLTRSGVGKASVQLVVDLVSSKIQEITSVEPWNCHENARKQVLQYAADLLRSKFHIAIDQVENTIKPYKFEVEATDLEWKNGQQRAVETLEIQILQCQDQLKSIKSLIGRRKLRQAMRYLDHIGISKENSPFNRSVTNIPDHVLEKAEQAVITKGKLSILSQRLAAVKSRQCQSISNKSCCPEVFLSVVSEKLAATAVMFIYIELLNEFFFQLPREVDSKLYYSLDQKAIKAFCKENSSVAEHLTAQERKETLELVMNKLRAIRRHP
jgi:dynamin-like GTPase MGM1, mitochondrial